MPRRLLPHPRLDDVMNRFLLVALLLLPMLARAADPAPAADTKPAAAAPAKAAPAKPAAGKPAANTTLTSTEKAASLSTNVVGTQEAPTVLNVVPWKDKEVKLEKKNPATSILNKALQPLDRDVLRREVQYFRSLQEQTQ